tara:strand:- start:389 stop:598 length:210 start_codon:yes stop_codon:yes gene_type:complete
MGDKYFDMINQDLKQIESNEPDVIIRGQKQKGYLLNELRMQVAELNFVKAEVNYERELRVKGAKYHVNT